MLLFTMVFVIMEGPDSSIGCVAEPELVISWLIVLLCFSVFDVMEDSVWLDVWLWSLWVSSYTQIGSSSSSMVINGGCDCLSWFNLTGSMFSIE